MTAKRKPARLDAIDLTLLAELQRDARQSHAALGRKVGLSRPAVADRIARLERLGIVTGYHAAVDARRLGWNIEAFVQFRTRGGGYEQAVAAIVAVPEVVECHRMTGTQFLVIRVRAVSTEHLQRIIQKLTRIGDTETSIVLSTPLARRPAVPPPEKD